MSIDPKHYADAMSPRRRTAFKSLCDDLNNDRLPWRQDISLCGPRLVHDIEEVPIVLTPFGVLVAAALGHPCPVEHVIQKDER